MFHRLAKRRGLRAKIVTWVLIPAAIILAAVGGLVLYASQRVTEELVLERNQDRTRLLANQLSAGLEAYRQPLSAVAAAIGSEWPSDRQKALLDRRLASGDLQVFDAGVLVLDLDGTVVAAVPTVAGVTGRSLRGLAASPEISRDEDLLLTIILFDRIRGMNVIALSHPLRGGGGDFHGTVVGLFHTERGATRVSTFYRNIWNLYIGRRETAMWWTVPGALSSIWIPS